MGEVTPRVILHAYRSLLRYSRRAVMYSQPASTVARDLLRASFRDKEGKYDETAISRTGYFLHKAGKEAGIEHRIVKNLLFCKYWKDHNAHIARLTWSQIVDVDNAQGKAARKPNTIADTAYVQYQKCIEAVNRMEGLCLPTKW